MNYGVFDLVSFGVVAMLAALMALIGMVHFDLGPTVRLQPHRRLLLGLALGAGILAFALKLFLIAGFVTVAPPQARVDLPTGRGEGSKPSPASSSRYSWTPLSPVREGVVLANHPSDSGYTWQALPLQAPAPDWNPTTPEKVALGQALFNDPLLSKDGSVSCASCHALYRAGGADGLKSARGIHDQTGDRNTPTVWNAAFQSLLFWDGRATSLEEQAKGPLLNPLEMGMPSFAAVEARVKAQTRYRLAFAEAFGPDSGIHIAHIAEAIAAYERSLITPDTPYDRFVRGDLTALTPQQLRGMALFESLGCVNCHHGPNFSAASLFDDRMPYRVFPANPTPYEKDYPLLDSPSGGGRSAWRVPSLRNVALTGPWLHNGSVTELEEVVRIMAAAQLGWSGHYLLWSESSKTLQEMDRPVPSEEQIADIVAFLHALSGDRLTSLGQKKTTATVDRDNPATGLIGQDNPDPSPVSVARLTP